MPQTIVPANRLEKFALKLFVEKPESLDLDAAIPIFHRWIQTGQVDGLLIDVADYRQVPDGPGVLLVGHEADHILDRTEGPMGLLFNRKRLGHGSDAERLRADLRRALHACRLLEQEPALKQAGLRFQGQRLRLILNDRLAALDRAETVAAMRLELEAVARELYPGQLLRIEESAVDPRARIALDVTTDDTVNVSTLLDRLG